MSANNTETGLNFSLASLTGNPDDQNSAHMQEYVSDMPIANIEEFPGHPFKHRDEDSMTALAASIAKYGLFHPILVMPQEDKPGYYYAIAGHRRMQACASLGMENIPAITHNITLDEAVVIMADSNIHQRREDTLLSELCWAYRMKKEAIERMPKELRHHVAVTGTRTSEIVAQETDKSSRTIERYIQFTNLIPPLLDYLDSGKMKQWPALEISYLRPGEQEYLADIIESSGAFPSEAQAKQMRRISSPPPDGKGELVPDDIDGIMGQLKGNQKTTLKLESDIIEEYFSPRDTPQDMQQKITFLLDVERACNGLFSPDIPPEQTVRRLQIGAACDGLCPPDMPPDRFAAYVRGLEKYKDKVEAQIHQSRARKAQEQAAPPQGAAQSIDIHEHDAR